MSLRFSLLGLLGLVTISALACAALVKPGPGWLSVVLSFTVAAVGMQLLRVIFARGAARAGALGWLVFAVGYLAIAIGPWLGHYVGPQLASSKALVYAQVSWRKEDSTPPSLMSPGQLRRMSLDLWGRSSNTLLVSDGAWLYSALVPGQPVPVNCFQLSGHWLAAWLAGWLGAALAVHFQRQSQTKPSATARPTA